MLILGVALRVGALAALASPWTVAAALIVAHALGRAAIPVAMQGLAPARSQGLGATVGQPSPSTAGIAATWAMAIAWLSLPNGTAAAAVVAVALAAAGLASLALRQIGGQTGDVLGAIEQSGEIAALLAIVAMA
jgi:adenosylcobinamide-GDP ribazoletransferase